MYKIWFSTHHSIAACTQHDQITYDDGRVFEWWGEFIGWMIAVSAALVVPIYATIMITGKTGNFQRRIWQLIQKIENDNTNLEIVKFSSGRRFVDAS